MKQRFTSKQTSINSTKAPAVYSMKKAAALLITVYEGDGSGTGRQTAADSWQENRRTADYMDEIAAALPGWNVARFGRLIQATQKR